MRYLHTCMLKLRKYNPAKYSPSSETQGQSVESGEKARRTFSSTGGKASGYRLSSDHFQTVKRMLASDWAQKNVLYYCAPIGEQHRLSSFRVFVQDGYCLAVPRLYCTCPFRSPRLCVQGNFIFYFTSQKRKITIRPITWVNVLMLSAEPFQFAPRKSLKGA